MTSARSFLVSTALQLGLNSWDVLILASVSTLEETGKYAAASRLAMAILIVVRVTNTVFSHRFSALYASGSIQELRYLFNKVKIYSLLISILLLAMLVLAYSNIQLWLGGDYDGTALLVLLLASTNLLLVAAGPVSQMLNMTGNEHHVAKITGMWSGGSILINLALIPFMGSLGAAIAYAITNVLMRLQLSSKLNEKIFDK